MRSVGLISPTGIAKLFFRDALCRVDVKGEKVAYLTFDDGPIPEVTPLVLDILAKYNAKATFFCVGDNVRKHPQLLQRVISEGHSVGNHTFNHLKGWETPDDVYLKNIEDCAKLIHSSLFRPPYGKIKLSQYKKVKKKFKVVLWDVLSGDYDKALSAEKCLDVVKKYTRPGSILVFHDNVKALDKLPSLLTGTLDFMRESGYTLNALSPSI